MTEQQWPRTEAPDAMLRFLGTRAGARKLRLFACACCRRIWHLLGKKTRGAAELAERFADRQATAKELAACEASVKGSQYYAGAVQAACWSTARIVYCARVTAERARLAAARAAEPRQGRSLDPGCRAEGVHQAALLRCLFGNPFRPVTIEPAVLAWGEGTVVRVAQGIYAERAFERMPILADALEEAGCESAEVLAHCRQAGEHARGCWVLDAALGIG
jgi:hypothetical protein